MAHETIKDPIGRAFMQAVDEGLERDRLQINAVYAEIQAKGYQWAAEEIWRLRRRIKSAATFDDQKGDPGSS